MVRKVLIVVACVLFACFASTAWAMDIPFTPYADEQADSEASSEQPPSVSPAEPEPTTPDAESPPPRGLEGFNARLQGGNYGLGGELGILTYRYHILFIDILRGGGMCIPKAYGADIDTYSGYAGIAFGLAFPIKKGSRTSRKRWENEIRIRTALYGGVMKYHGKGGVVFAMPLEVSDVIDFGSVAIEVGAQALFAAEGWAGSWSGPRYTTPMPSLAGFVGFRI